MSLTFSQLGARQRESDIARLMTLAVERPELLSLAAGFTDTATLPLSEVSSLVEALAGEGDKAVLQYGANRGRAGLQDLVARRVSQQDGLQSSIPYASENALITNGSQQALYLAVQTLCDPGDIVLVEQPTYFVFLEMLRGLGVKAVPMPMLDSGDVDTDGLGAQLKLFAAAGELSHVKAVYLVSYYANPSGHSISKSCKEQIFGILSEQSSSIALIEDAAYRELYYETPHEASGLLALAGKVKVPVFYTSTFTKPFATGLKVGFGICGHEEWLARMLAVKGQQDFGTSHFNQAIVEKALLSGSYDEHLAGIRVSYQQKMRILDALLRCSLEGTGWSWEQPAGGLYLWMRAPKGIQTDFESPFYQRCIEEGVMYVPGDLCFAEHSDHCHVRLSFGVLDGELLEEAGKRFANVCLALC